MSSYRMSKNPNELFQSLSSDDADTRMEAAKEIKNIAEENPTPLLDYISEFDKQLNNETTNLEKEEVVHLLQAVTHIAKEHPVDVSPLSEHLFNLYNWSRYHPGNRDMNLSASASLGMIAKEYPDVAKDYIEKFAESTRHGNHKIEANSLAILGDLAETYPEEVSGHLDIAVESLDADDNNKRANATLMLYHLAGHDPDMVYDAIEIQEVVNLLDDETEIVRENACWILSNLSWRADDTVPILREVSDTDESERVRKVADQAVRNIVQPG